MTKFTDELLAGGAGWVAERTSDGLSVGPTGASVEALEAFQPIAENIIANAGRGYSIPIRPHRTSDHAVDYVDLITLTLDE